MSIKLNQLITSEAGPRELSQLMLDLDENDWKEIFTTIDLPKKITDHITKYFKITKNKVFVNTVSSVLSEVSLIDTVSAKKALSALSKNKSISDDIKDSLNTSAHTITKSSVIKEEIKKTPAKKTRNNATKTTRNSFQTNIKANIKTKFGIVSEMQVGIEEDSVFSGLFVLNKQTYFVNEGQITTSNNLDNKIFENILSFLDEHGIIVDKEIDDTLFILTKKWNNQYIFTNKIGISSFLSNMTSAEKEILIQETIQNNIKTLFLANRMASFINDIDPKIAERELSKINVSLEILKDI